MHVFTHGAYLSKERGRIVLEDSTSKKKGLPIEDLKAIIIAARGVTFSSNLISSLLRQKTLVLYCDETYQPIGWILPIEYTRDQRLLSRQISLTPHLASSLFSQILQFKVQNQFQVLRQFQEPCDSFQHFLFQDKPDEATAARMYWRHFFKNIHGDETKRDREQPGPVNSALNYGYAVLSSLVHRSTVVHGLISQIGIHHKSRYRSYPLLYDLMEPLRPFVDLMLVKFLSENEDVEEFSDWAKFIAHDLRSIRVDHLKHKLKLVDAIDFYVRSYIQALLTGKKRTIWAPVIETEKKAA